MEKLEVCPGCGKRRETASAPSESLPIGRSLSASRKRLKAQVHKRVKFGDCDPANIVMAAAAISLPALGVTFGFLAVLVICAMVLVVLW